ncbi:MAG TPA: hypothetical protein VK666_25565 [Chryseolinea sp.]|nr:hypothetical protein [Chryseolinea sp.]
MKQKPQLLASCLLVAMALGTAWAVRGKFGHEQGAAWAGAIGAVALIMVSKRTDWYAKVFRVALAAAVGWGMGGMISYGMVVGYGRGNDFLNVYYGLAMLFVIGGLYGFTGGGLLGIALVDTDEDRIDWPRLLTEMVAFGIVTYALVIYQLEWLMTPPRSEMWAACLGASFALCWFIFRLKQWNVLKVATLTSIGSGFGFAFGNVLQVLGSNLLLPLNLWNVMEYSIGFFGGLGMAYATFTSAWHKSEVKRDGFSNTVPILLLTLVIPFIVWDQSFTMEKLSSLLNVGGTEQWITWVQVTSLLLIAAVTWLLLIRDQRAIRKRRDYDFNAIRYLFTVYLGVFTLLSFLVTGVYVHPFEQYLYIINIAMVLIISGRVVPSFTVAVEPPFQRPFTFILVMLILAASAFVMINSHGELKGSQVRFER